MPKEKQTRKQWIAKLRRAAVGPYFKVTVFFIIFCLFVCCCCFFFKHHFWLGFHACYLHVSILTLLYITIYR